ncbi:MAG: hypothetical protein QOG54_682 [Actinomycetota bacterium]|nr:hypothetical protein [Actinomycetota bacterium]
MCPPYDVISTDLQAALYDRHPHNAIRLELPNEDYAQVCKRFREWIDESVLSRDDPSLYVYRQDFTAEDGDRRRVTGVIGALQLEEFGARSGVLPHEQTMPGPKKDRLSLMRACPVNFSPIYAIYRGRGELAPFFDSLENRPPVYRFQDGDGILHRFWPVTASAEVEMLSSALEPGPLVIADGHHRYETALEFHRELQAAGEPGEHDAIMTFCVDADSEGLVVLPYNRAVKTATPVDEIVARIEERFGGKEIDPDETQERLASSAADHPMAIVTADRTFFVEISDDQVRAVTGDKHPAWRSLDVVALHEVVLPAALDDEPELSFSKDPAEVVNLVTKGGFTFGVLLKAMRASDVVDVARSGERMPQKASYFWPKALTGLVFRPLKDL